MKERNNAVEALKNQHMLYKEKCEDEERLDAKVKELVAENRKMYAENLNFADLKAQIDSLISALNESEDKRRAL
jgi:hypothetical protein